MTTFARDIQAMMDAWNTIIADARVQFPKLSEEEIFQIAKGALCSSLNVAKC